MRGIGKSGFPYAPGSHGAAVSDSEAIANGTSKNTHLRAGQSALMTVM